jgi:hypothetical protein
MIKLQNGIIVKRGMLLDDDEFLFFVTKVTNRVWGYIIAEKDDYDDEWYYEIKTDIVEIDISECNLHDDQDTSELLDYFNYPQD